MAMNQCRRIDSKYRDWFGAATAGGPANGIVSTLVVRGMEFSVARCDVMRSAIDSRRHHADSFRIS